MTIRIPRYLAVGIAAALLVGGGIGIGVALGGKNTTATTRLPCTRAAARQAILQSKFFDDVAQLAEISQPNHLFGTYSLQLVGCRDLTGDGNPEMVVQLSCCTAGAFSPWAIFTSQGARWRLAADRLQTPEAQLRFTHGGIEEVTPAWAPGDPMCCASGKREGLVSYQDGRFVYQPRIGPTSRTGAAAINTTSPALLNGSIAGLDLLSSSLPRAIELLSTPTSFGRSHWSCPAKWRDIGLEILFYDLAGAYGCGSKGRVESIALEGPEAEQAGWLIDGLRVGMPFSDVERRYPDAQPEGRATRERLQSENKQGTPFALAEKETGYEGRVPVIVVRAAYGTVVAIELNVQAVGA